MQDRTYHTYHDLISEAELRELFALLPPERERAMNAGIDFMAAIGEHGNALSVAALKSVLTARGWAWAETVPFPAGEFEYWRNAEFPHKLTVRIPDPSFVDCSDRVHDAVRQVAFSLGVGVVTIAADVAPALERATAQVAS